MKVDVCYFGKVFLVFNVSIYRSHYINFKTLLNAFSNYILPEVENIPGTIGNDGYAFLRFQGFYNVLCFRNQTYCFLVKCVPFYTGDWSVVLILLVKSTYLCNYVDTKYRCFSYAGMQA